MSESLNQTWGNTVLEGVGQLVVIAPAKDGDYSELMRSTVSVNLGNLGRSSSSLLEEFNRLGDESVDADVGVVSFVLLCVARRRPHLNACSVQVHVVVVDVPVGLVAAYGVDPTVFAHQVLSGSHRSTNKCSVVVELVYVIEL